jgi:hypothetical protein
VLTGGRDDVAQVVTRHGDRTAINLLPNEAGVQWDCAVRSRRAMAKADDEEGDRGRDRALHDDGAYLIDPEHPYAHDFWAGNCSNGQVASPSHTLVVFGPHHPQ